MKQALTKSASFTSADGTQIAWTKQGAGPPLFDEDDPDFTLRAEAERRIGADLADAHHWFDTQLVGVPEEILAGMPPLTDEGLRNTRTIIHELSFLPGTPAKRFAPVTTPTLIIASDHTAPSILQWASQLEEAMTNATQQVLPGEWHGVDDARLTLAICRYGALDLPAR